MTRDPPPRAFDFPGSTRYLDSASGTGPAVHPVPSVETVLNVAAGCSLRCTFCDRSPDRVGVQPSDLEAPDFPLPAARRVVIGSGDTLRAGLAPLVARLRAADAEEVVIYAHAGSDPSALAPLAAAGLTGVLVQVPAADAEGLARLTRGTASLARLARLLDAAGAAGLQVECELPVLPSTRATLAATLRRALNRIARPGPIHLAFGAEGLSGPPAPWDFREAAADVQAALAEAASRGVEVRFASPAPPPCVLDLGDALPALYPALKASGPRPEARPFEACDACAVAGVCAPRVPHFAPAAGSAPVRPIAAPARTGGPSSSAELFLRHATLEGLRARLARGPRPTCLSPWSVLAAHNPNGAVAPCRGSLLREEVYAVTGNWLRQPFLEVWNSDGMRQVRRAQAAGTPRVTCKDHCPVFFGAAHTLELPAGVPTGRVFADNLALQVREMLDGADELRSRPIGLVVSPSLTCNNRCRMCPVHDDERPWTEMPPEAWRSIEELLPTLHDLSFAGAEPLTSPRFADLVARCDADRHPDLGMTLTTNGLLLDAALLRDMGRARFRTVIVSVNAATPATYERITGTAGGFERLMANVDALAAAARDWRRRPRIVLSFVAMRSNLHELAGFVGMAHARGLAFRLLPVERDPHGESLFTDAGRLRAAIATIEAEVRPRVAGMPAALRDEVEVLLARMRHRLESGALAPL